MRILIAMLLVVGAFVPGCATTPCPSGQPDHCSLDEAYEDVRWLECGADACGVAALAGAEPWIAVDAADPSHAVVAAMAGSAGGIYHPWIGAAVTTDGGATWAPSHVGGGPNDVQSDFAAYDFAADAMVAFSGDTVVLVALLGNQAPPFTCVAVTCLGSPVSVNALDLVAWTSTDGGLTFVPSTVIAEGQGGPAYVSVPQAGGLSQDVGNFPDREILAADPVTGSLAVAWTQRGTLSDGTANALQWSTSTDAGATWTAPRTLLPSHYGPGLALHDGTVLLASRDVATDAFDLLRSTDFGATWSDPMPVGQGNGYDTLALTIWPSGGVVHAALALPGPEGNGVLLRRSADGGETWDPPQAAFNGTPTLRRLPNLAVDGNGNGVLATYQEVSPDTLVLQAAPVRDGRLAGAAITVGNLTSTRWAAFDYFGVAASENGTYVAWGADPESRIDTFVARLHTGMTVA